MNIQRLKLDSDISGFNIGKYIFRKSINSVYDDLIREFKEYHLIYLNAKFPKEIIQFLKSYDWILADIKITLSQDIKQIIFNKTELNNNDFYNRSDTDRLLQLGIDLYKESRFYFDKNTRILGKKIYKEWINNSINKSLADEIIVHRDSNNRIIGFITIKINNDFVEPVLVKVDRNFTGKGYGKILMNKFFSFIASKYPDININVHTQLKNLAAIKFYQSFGLKIIDYDFIYHIYPNGFIKM